MNAIDDSTRICDDFDCTVVNNNCLDLNSNDTSIYESDDTINSIVEIGYFCLLLKHYH